MYYKLIKDDKVVDILDSLIYLKWQRKHKRTILSEEADAQAVLGSDKNTVWHIRGLPEIPDPNCETVELVRIDRHEYQQLKALNGKTPEEIIDNFVLTLLEDNVI